MTGGTITLPRAAAQRLLDNLHARIDSAHLSDVPVFPGIVELHDALALAPAEPTALEFSIATIEAWERSGEHLAEIENEVAFSESVCLCLHELKRLRGCFVWPAQLTPVLREVLGLMCFQLGPAAHVYRDAGEFVDGDGAALKRRAEDEQAFMLHKIVGIALEHGEKWRGFVEADVSRAMEIVVGRKPGAKA